MAISTVTLIGMPGAGKSTVGVLLAKAMALDFVDTDLVIQSSEGKSLRTLIDELGREEFCALEERYLLALELAGKVVAPGGSAVYSAAAMDRLRRHGPIVYLKLPLPILERRVGSLEQRGVIRDPGQTLADLLNEREPLYEAAASVTVACENRAHEAVVNAIRLALEKK